MVLIVSIGEKLDKATGLMAEAKEILKNPDAREKMRIESYLGEIGETECLSIALIKAEEAVKILNEHMPGKVDIAQKILDDIQKRIKKLTKPPEPEPEPIPVIKEIKIKEEKDVFKPIKKKTIKKTKRKVYR